MELSGLGLLRVRRWCARRRDGGRVQGVVGVGTGAGSACTRWGLAGGRRGDADLGAAYADVFGGIPDELEEAVVVSLLEDHEGGLVDLAADADDAAAHDGRGVAHGDVLRVDGRGGRIGSRSTRSGAAGGCSICTCGGGSWSCSDCARGIRARTESTGAGAGLAADAACGSAGSVRLAGSTGHLANAQRRIEAADEVARGADIDEAPRAIFLVHGIFVSLAHEADAADFGLGQIIERVREATKFAIVKLDAARVLLAAPDHFFFFFAFAFGKDAQADRHSADDEQRSEKHDEQQGVAALLSSRSRHWRFIFHMLHADGGAACSSNGVVPGRPLEIS